MPSSACSAAPLALHSFPTRRSSDLPQRRRRPGAIRGRFDELLLVAAVAEYVQDARSSQVLEARLGVGVRFERLVQLEVVNEDADARRSEEHTSELQSLRHLVCRLLLAPPPPSRCTLSLHDALPIFHNGVGVRELSEGGSTNSSWSPRSRNTCKMRARPRSSKRGSG